MKKTKGNKGMALITTLVTFTIVTVMCALMLTVSLYTTQMAKISQQDVFARSDLDEMGNYFLTNGRESFEAKYPGGKNGDYKLEYSSATAKTQTLTVKDSKGTVLMQVSYVDTGVGGEINIEPKSWNYGGK